MIFRFKWRNFHRKKSSMQVWINRWYPAKRPYPSCLCMADRALLAGYPQNVCLGISLTIMLVQIRDWRCQEIVTCTIVEQDHWWIDHCIVWIKLVLFIIFSRLCKIMNDFQRDEFITGHVAWLPVASFTKQGNPRLAKHTLKTNWHLFS